MNTIAEYYDFAGYRHEILISEDTALFVDLNMDRETSQFISDEYMHNIGYELSAMLNRIDYITCEEGFAEIVLFSYEDLVKYEYMTPEEYSRVIGLLDDEHHDFILDTLLHDVEIELHNATH